LYQKGTGRRSISKEGNAEGDEWPKRDGAGKAGRTRLKRKGDMSLFIGGPPGGTVASEQRICSQGGHKGSWGKKERNLEGGVHN